MGLAELVAMSNRYGSNSEFVLAGGGNTSFKDAETLYVKGSGSALATIQAEQFVVMDRAKLTAMMDQTYPAKDDEREAAALADMMAARRPGQEAKRPSVETTLHNLFPFSYVLHVHPALVNGLTCSLGSDKLTAELFPEAVFVPICKPGYVLATTCRKALDAFKAKTGKDAQMLILENHGIFLSADTVEEIDRLMDGVMAKLKEKAPVQPDFSSAEFDAAAAAALAPAIRMAYEKGKAGSVKFLCNKEIAKLVASKEAFQALAEPFTPDHIVYCKAHPLFLPAGIDTKGTAEAMEAYRLQHGYSPKVVAVEKLGAFLVGKNKKDAETAATLLLDAAKIAVYASQMGGLRPMTPEFVDFIVNWETESYRAKMNLSAGSEKRLEDKIALVTGSAQGFGKGIAEEMVKQGAFVVIADMNFEGAKACAEQLCTAYGPGRALPVAANVADEESVKAMFQAAALEYGGLDIYVNNAGIAKAGSLEEMDKRTFELVTSVNYTAYFLCTKYATQIMKIQHSVAPEYMMDVIEINSKSGLAGSNKNFAYAGSKFGGIGLTQSFAMELAPYNIKVNAVCPGNYLDGPLWSDPERGLFVQYLKAGKVPGAKTVEDVRRSYESKVPLNRGCFPLDVARAIFYIVEQTYETGQAVPVTGGQEMLK